MKKIIALLLVSVLALGMCLTGCGQEDTPETTVAAAAGTEATEDEIVIGVSMHCASSFFDGVIEGVEAYVAENGGRIINVDGRSDANYQMGVIEDFIAQGVDAVVYCPVDSIAATPALKLLKNAGIPVINIDSAVDAYDMIDAFVATDNYEAGKIAGEALVKNDPDGGKVAILDYPINEADLSAIFVICDDSAQGAYAAIKSSGLNIPLYSVNGGPESKAAFREDGVDGVWKCSPAQSPYTIGYKGTEAAYKIIAGEKVEKEIFIPSFAIDATNVADYPGDWQ